VGVLINLFSLNQKCQAWKLNLLPRKVIEKEVGRVPVAHACNPSYSGGRDQEDRGLNPAWANSARALPKIPIAKMTGRVAQGVGPEFKQKWFVFLSFFFLLIMSRAGSTGIIVFLESQHSYIRRSLSPERIQARRESDSKVY
jgi:hypothetical protein